MEILDVVDENGIPTGARLPREEVHRVGALHRTSHVWLTRSRNGAAELLLQKRSAQKDSHPGCYDISSAGHIPAGDDFLESALRELREELGITAAPEELTDCGQLRIVCDAVFHGAPFHDRQISRVYLLRCDRPEAAFTVQESEIESVRWFPLAECYEMARTGAPANCLRTDELDLVAAQL
jgi:8-oxo-dGTP pyrophosphatase MutT (NUDIX family)